MHVEVLGAGPALVLVHGWAMHGGIFAPLVERLREHFTLHVVDLPGHGHGRAQPLPLSLPALAHGIAAEVPPATWLGWSLGGLVAMQAANDRPDVVRGLVAVCASPCFVHRPDWPAGMPAGVFRQFAADLEGDYRGTLDRFLMLEAQGSDHMRDELRLLRAALFARGEPDRRVLREGLALLEDSDLRTLLPGLAVPSLWVAGRRDRLVPPAAMRAAAELAPASRYVEVSGGGHAPFLTHAGDVAEAVLSFYKEMPA